MADTDKRHNWEKDPSELNYDWGNMAFVDIDSGTATGLQGAFFFDKTPEGTIYWWENRHTTEGHERWRKMSELYREHIAKTSGTAEDPAAITDAEVTDEASGD